MAEADRDQNWSAVTLIEQVAAVIRQEFTPGSIITNSWLRMQFGLGTPITAREQVLDSHAFMNLMADLQEALLHDSQVYLMKDRTNRGWEWVAPKEQAARAEHYQVRKARRALRKGEDVLRNVDFEALDAEQIKRVTDAQVRMAGRRKALYGKAPRATAAFEPKLLKD